MAKFEIAIVEVRSFVGNSDDPIISPTYKSIAFGNSPKEAMVSLEGFLANSEASIVESDEDARYLKIDMPNLVLECEVAGEEEASLNELMSLIASKI